MQETQLDLKSHYIEQTKTILKKNTDKNMIIWFFGSRVTAHSKPFSDLDIALQNTNNKLIPLKTIATIKADFIESDLPFKVDIIDYNSVFGIFKKNIDKNKIKISLSY